MLHLPGRFQADNARAGGGAGGSGGRARMRCRCLPQLEGVRGRLERAVVLPNGAAAYVDYAHTPDAIARVLSALRPHAVGQTGDRVRRRRRPGCRQAAVDGRGGGAGRGSVIVTDDNPRSEAPAAIRAAILAACPGAHGNWRPAGGDCRRAGDVGRRAMCWWWPARAMSRGRLSAARVFPFDDAGGDP